MQCTKQQGQYWSLLPSVSDIPGVSKKGEIQMEYRQKCDEENRSVTKHVIPGVISDSNYAVYKM